MRMSPPSRFARTVIPPTVMQIPPSVTLYRERFWVNVTRCRRRNGASGDYLTGCSVAGGDVDLLLVDDIDTIDGMLGGELDAVGLIGVEREAQARALPVHDHVIHRLEDELSPVELPAHHGRVAEAVEDGAPVLFVSVVPTRDPDRLPDAAVLAAAHHIFDLAD